jgi:hypothetical protein
MRTKTINVYKFSELSEQAKERAKQNYASHVGYSWSQEAMDSLVALANHFDGKLSNWQIDWFNSSYSSAKFEMPELSEKEIRAKLKELGSYNKRTGKGHGDCVLTGYCADENAIDGFRLAFRKGERDMNELMQAAFDSWLKAAQADCEDFYSDEQFADHCEANNYEFYENGKIA